MTSPNGPAVSFRLLGPIAVFVDGREVHITAGKQRVILTALLLRPNHTVPNDDLIDMLWEDPSPISDVRGALQKYVMRLRRLLRVAGAPRDLIVTESDGYRITVLPGQRDLDGFEELCAEATHAAESEDIARESELLSKALALWTQVPPLANVLSTALQRYEAAGLVERYLRAFERRAEVDLRLGRYTALTAELRAVVRQYPERERFWAQWMRALHGAGRQGEALAAYRQAAQMLAEELGVEPGADLRAAHQEVLGTSRVVTRKHAAPSRRPPGPTVRQLPRDAVPFIGRQAELERLAGGLRQAPVVIHGAAGVGKTALAVRAAHRLADRFPDGQLYVDLRGYADSAPVNAAQVLGTSLLSSLGVAPGSVPETEEQRIATYRSLLADRRMLVLLDNAAHVEQVRPLLPGSLQCGVIITSRNELAGLAVSPGVERLRLAELPTGQAHQLLAMFVGQRRVVDDSRAVSELIDLCGGVALALRVAATHLTRHPELRIGTYVKQLRSADGITALRIDGDRMADVPAALDWSYRLLPSPHRRFLGALALIPTTDFTVSVAAQGGGVTEAEAATALEALAELSLLSRLPGHRYQIHGLVRSYVKSRRFRSSQVPAAPSWVPVVTAEVASPQVASPQVASPQVDERDRTCHAGPDAAASHTASPGCALPQSGIGDVIGDVISGDRNRRSCHHRGREVIA